MKKITKVDIDKVLKILKVVKPLYRSENKNRTIHIKGLRSERDNKKLVIV